MMKQYGYKMQNRRTSAIETVYCTAECEFYAWQSVMARLFVAEMGSYMAWAAALIVLSAVPHPNDYFSSKGKTLADYYRYVKKTSKNMKEAIAKARGAK